MRAQGLERTRVRRIVLDDPADAAALVDLLDHYARDPMGGGAGLAVAAKRELAARLAEVPGYVGGLAFDGAEAVGLINCFTGFSTFAARPLLNVHDLVVVAGRRGRGVGQALLGFAEAEARRLGCCKLTLEVLTGNAAALRAYERAGFRPYALDPAAGTATFLEKRLPPAVLP
jgi:GNAT superfamily N-acetyltransferase